MSKIWIVSCGRQNPVVKKRAWDNAVAVIVAYTEPGAIGMASDAFGVGREYLRAVQVPYFPRGIMAKIGFTNNAGEFVLNTRPSL